MSDVPADPEAFFLKFAPERLRPIAGQNPSRSSPGSMVFRVGTDEFSFRVTNGNIVTERGMQPDALLQVTIPSADFEPVVVRSARLFEAEPNRDHQLLAFKALTLDEDRLALIRPLQGTVLVAISDGPRQHSIFLTPGAGAPNTARPECTLECAMSDFLDMQSGKQHPIQLAFAGRIRVIGNAQLAMGLSSVLG